MVAGIMLLRWAFGIEKIIALLKQIELNTNSHAADVALVKKGRVRRFLEAEIEENTSKK